MSNNGLEVIGLGIVEDAAEFGASGRASSIASNTLGILNTIDDQWLGMSCG